MKIRAAIASFFLAACGQTLVLPSVPVREDAISLTFHCDVNFSAEERVAVERAAELWQKQSGGIADAKCVWDFDSKSPYSLTRFALSDTVTRASGTTPAVADARKTMGRVVGLHVMFRGIRSIYVVADDLSNGMDGITQVAAHELGHTFGVDHTGIKGSSIMHDPLFYLDTVCLDRHDLEGLCKASGMCGGKTIYPCGEP